MSKNGITEQVEDALTYPILTQQVDLQQPSTDTQGVITSGGSSVDSVALNTIRRILGWRYRAADTKGFTAALIKTFTLKEVEGHLEWEWKPQNYMAQADLGEVTGAQASIYSRAKVALDQSLPLLDGLTPLITVADPADYNALRTIVRGKLTELVNELGIVGGPRVQKVDQLFELLIGLNPRTKNPERVSGNLGRLRDLLGLERKHVSTVDEEVNLTNFLILVDYVNSLYITWKAQSKFLGRSGGAEPFLGTQLVLLSQALEALAEAVREAYDAMDSVFLGPAERQTTILRLSGEPPITLAELLNWVEDFATVEAVELLQDGGKEGVQVVAFTADRLQRLVRLTYEKSESSEHQMRAFHTARTRRALQEILVNLETVTDEAQKIRRPDETLTNFPEIQSVSPRHVKLATPPGTAPPPVPITIKGSNLLGGSPPSEVKITLASEKGKIELKPADPTSSTDSQLVVSWKDNIKVGIWDLVLENASGEDFLDAAITVTQLKRGYDDEYQPDAATTGSDVSDEVKKQFAYLLSELRKRNAWHGDEQTDWLDAEWIVSELVKKSDYSKGSSKG
jgi:hypothetical protein